MASLTVGSITLYTVLKLPACQLYGMEKTLEWLKTSRDIRQEDAISLYIFVLCMKRLGHIIHTVDSGRWKPIRLSHNGPHLSHFLFTNDLIQFVEASIDQIRDGMLGSVLHYVRAKSEFT